MQFFTLFKKLSVVNHN